MSLTLLATTTTTIPDIGFCGVLLFLSSHLVAFMFCAIASLTLAGCCSQKKEGDVTSKRKDMAGKEASGIAQAAGQKKNAIVSRGGTPIGPATKSKRDAAAAAKKKKAADKKQPISKEAPLTPAAAATPAKLLTPAVQQQQGQEAGKNAAVPQPQNVAAAAAPQTPDKNKPAAAKKLGDGKVDGSGAAAKKQQLLPLSVGSVHVLPPSSMESAESVEGKFPNLKKSKEAAASSQKKPPPSSTPSSTPLSPSTIASVKTLTEKVPPSMHSDEADKSMGVFTDESGHLTSEKQISLATESKASESTKGGGEFGGKSVKKMAEEAGTKTGLTVGVSFSGELNFNMAMFGIIQSRTVELSNASDERVAIKIRTPNPNLFQVAPMFRTLEPNGKTLLTVTRRASPPTQEMLRVFVVPSSKWASPNEPIGVLFQRVQEKDQQLLEIPMKLV